MEKSTIVITDLGNLRVKTFLDNFRENKGSAFSLLHTHIGYEFQFVLSGNVYIEMENEKISLCKDDCAILLPDTFHKISGTEDSRVLCFSFFVDKNTKVITNDYYSMVLDSIGNEQGCKIIRQNLQISDYLRKILISKSSDAPFSLEITKALLMLLYSEIIRGICDLEPLLKNTKTLISQNDYIVKKIEEYYNEYYMEEISLKELSKLLHLSEKQTNRIIKKNFGTEFNEHLRKIRLKNAQKFLRESNEGVKDIAFAVGYKSYNGFYLAFKNAYGITPLEYRIQQKQTITDE